MQGTSFSGDILKYRKDGAPFTCHINIEPIYNADGGITHFIGAIRGDVFIEANKMFVTSFDVSKEMQWEKEKKLNQQQLDRVLKLALASEVSTGIAHQINQPLSVVSSTLLLWESEKNKADSWRQEIINTLPNLIQMNHDMGETIHQVKNLLTADSVKESTSLCLKAACRALIQEEKAPIQVIMSH